MSGDLLASGSDDPDIVIWDWAKGEKKIAYKSGHINDVLQVKLFNNLIMSSRFLWGETNYHLIEIESK